MEKKEEQIIKQMDPEKIDKIKHYRILNQYVKKGAVLFTGSSLMEQFPIYEFLLDFERTETIYNRGVSGFTSSEMIPFLDTLIFDLEPSKVFINIGTNDLSAPDYTVEALMKRYEHILNRIRKQLPQTKIYVMAYYPGNENYDFGNEGAREWLKLRSNEKINKANAELEKLAQRLQVSFININEKLYDENRNLIHEYSVEGVHMYANGYRAILEDLMRYVSE